MPSKYWDNSFDFEDDSPLEKLLLDPMLRFLALLILLSNELFFSRDHYPFRFLENSELEPFYELKVFLALV